MSDDNLKYDNHVQDHGTLSPQVTESDNLKFIADLEKAGIPDDVVQQHIKDLGLEGVYDTSPRAQATRALAALKSDRNWVARFNAGDTDAVTDFNNLTYAMSQDVGPDAPQVKPEEYKLPQRHPVLDAHPELGERYSTETREWAASLQLSPEVASAVSEFHLDHAAKVATMTPNGAENYGHQQEAQLRATLARHNPDVEKALTDAAAALNKQSNRGYTAASLAAIARSSGARVALELVLHGQALAARRSS